MSVDLDFGALVAPELARDPEAARAEERSGWAPCIERVGTSQIAKMRVALGLRMTAFGAWRAA